MAWEVAGHRGTVGHGAGNDSALVPQGKLQLADL